VRLLQLQVFDSHFEPKKQYLTGKMRLIHRDAHQLRQIGAENFLAQILAPSIRLHLIS
jgi:hypothetical protein